MSAPRPEPRPQSPGLARPPDDLDAAEYAAQTGEDLARTLDLDTWSDGADLPAAMQRLEEEIADADAQETEAGRRARQVLLPAIKRAELPGSGVFRATRVQLERTQTHTLLCGGVEAADGVTAVHDTLPLTVAQVGVCLTSYAGGQGQWMHRTYRRDLRGRGSDPVEEALRLVERRNERSGLNQPGGPRDPLNELLRRGIMTYAERAVLLRKSDKPWRMGHGHPAPYELLSRAGHMGLLTLAIDVLSELILVHKRFVFVPSEPAERGLLTIGNALKPLEFAVIDTAESRLAEAIDRSHLREPFRELASDFVRDAGRCIAVGVYRTFAEAPPQLFYAHRDHAHEAALIAMADSLVQPHRNFPALIDLADTACRGLFGNEGFHSAVESVYARRGRPLAYLSERATRG